MSYPYDPQIAPVVPHTPVLDLSDVEGARALLSAPPADLSALPARITHLDAADGAPLELYLVHPAHQEPSAVLLWFHGGGFVLGDARDSLPFLADLAATTGAGAVSVQYSLAPESRFPTQLEEAHSTLEWLVAHSVLGAGRVPFAVGGQSAGAAIAAGFALWLRDEGGAAPFFQLLDIPVVDDTAVTQSATGYDDTLVWNRTAAALSWAAYLGESSDDVLAYASPSRAADLHGLPPTFITVNQFDPLRDEGIEYARRLAHANVPTELHLYPGTFHGSSGIAADAAVSRRQNTDLIAAFQRAIDSISPPNDERTLS